MTKLDELREDIRFDNLCEEFNKAVKNYHPYDDSAWSFLDIRQQEIMNAEVDNERKVEAFNGVLAAIFRIFPQNDKYYCQALSRQLAYADSNNPDAIKRIAQDAYMHQRNSSIEDYGKVIYEAYQKFTPKRKFPFAKIAQYYEAKHPILEEREKREDELGRISLYLEDGNFSPEKKLSLIEDAVELLKKPYFKQSKADDGKASFYYSAVRICREELFDTDLADEYLQKAQKCKENAKTARKHWQDDRGLTDDQVKEILKNTKGNKR